MDDATKAGQQGTGGQSSIAASSWLLDLASRALPPVFAEAIVSPFVLLEVLLRSLARTAFGLLAPLGLTTCLGVVLVWRMRRDSDLSDSMDDLFDSDEEA